MKTVKKYIFIAKYLVFNYLQNQLKSEIQVQILKKTEVCTWVLFLTIKK